MSASSPFGSRVKHKKGTLRDTIHLRAEATLSREGIANAVVCPDDIDKNEWIAVHAIDFYNDICVLYSVVHDYCTAETCQSMSAGTNFEFLWIDKQRYRRPTRLPARIYIDYLLNWLVTQFDDETLFPVAEDVPFPPDYKDQVGSMFRRMYRVFAHIWCNHKEVIQQLDCESSFRFSLTHYLFFVNQFDLVSPGDLRPLCDLVNELCPSLPLTIQMNAIENVKREQRRQQTIQPITYQKLTSVPHHSVTAGNRPLPADVSNGAVSVARRPSPQPTLRNDPSLYYSVNNIPNTATSTIPDIHNIQYSRDNCDNNENHDNQLKENMSPSALPVIPQVESNVPCSPNEQTREESDDSSGEEEYEEEEEPRKSCCIF